MTDDELAAEEARLHARAGQLELIIKNFRVSTNRGSIEGGFPNVKDLKTPIADITQRVARLNRVAYGLKFDGDSFRASGTLKEGYVFKARPGIP